MRRTRIVMLFALVALGCGAAEIVAADQVSVQLKWIHQAQFAGFYVAQEEGFYAEEGIDVSFVPGGVGVDVFAGVEDGSVEFSVVGADAVLIARSQGATVTAITTLYHVNPFILVAFADSGIESPLDFAGRTIAMSSESLAQFSAMLENVGVALEDVTLVPYTYDDTPFLTGEVDVTVSFAAGSLLPLREKVGDRALNIIWPDDYGVHFYSDTVIARDGLLRENPDLVVRFLRATIRGHEYSLENPEVALEATLRYAVNRDRDVQAEMFAASIPLIYTGRDPIGWMRSDVWQAMYDVLWKHGKYPESVSGGGRIFAALPGEGARWGESSVRLRPKLVFLFLLIGLVPLAVASTVAYLNSVDSLTKEACSYLSSISELKENELRRWLESTILVLESVANRPTFKSLTATRSQKGGDSSLLEQIEMEIRSAHLAPHLTAGLIQSLYVLDPTTGRILVSTESGMVGRFRRARSTSFRAGGAPISIRFRTPYRLSRSSCTSVRRFSDQTEISRASWWHAWIWTG